MKKLNLIGLVMVLAFALRVDAKPAPHHVSPATMNANTRELFKDSMVLDDQFYDEGAKLVRSPQQGHRTPARQGTFGSAYHMVRESSWYALGLLVRDEAGDRKRAADILDAVLKQQYLVPGKPWYGTYRRAPEEQDPGPDAVMWRQFDPNWRVFIGTTFEMILIEYPDRISPELAQRLYEAIDHGIEGEIAEKRLLPSYSNISLMYGALWDFAAAHNGRADWKKQSAEWTEETYRLFKQYDAFFEYNSPTYCGVDLYGLALWRSYGSTPRIRAIGSEMEAGLWRDIANLYQPDLRNISGPYDRAYGMDMESYVSVDGVWMRTVLDAKHAPLPPITAATDHVADAWFAPHIAVLGTRIPADALKKMTTFEGEHLVNRKITDQRSATAWIGKHVIFGGEATSKTKDVGLASQFHPATIQWRTPSGEIGWVQLNGAPMIDATADKHGITISAAGTIRIRIHATGADQTKVGANEWDLPGLKVAVTADSKTFSKDVSGDNIDVTYSGITGTRWEITPAE
jgi:hypothetical protein